MSLNILVARFGEFVAEQASSGSERSLTEKPFHPIVAQVRERVGHHLILLLLLAGADGETALAERAAIVDYCLDRLRRTGMNPSDDDAVKLAEYVLAFEPSRAQLGPALSRLETESKDNIGALIAAAQAVVDADGVRRELEIRFLEQLRSDLELL